MPITRHQPLLQRFTCATTPACNRAATALVASVMRPHMSRVELQSRLEDRVGKLAEAGANLSVRTARQAALEGVSALVARDVLVEEGQTLRVRDRLTLRYYARSIEHLLTPPRRTTH